jgi:hypothetical protein
VAEQEKERSILEQRPAYLEAIKPQTLDEALAQNLKVVKEWNVTDVPSYYFAGPDGKKIASFCGGSLKEFREVLDLVLKKFPESK